MAYRGTQIASASRSGEGKRDLYAEVTQRIIRQIEDGILPWARPWNASAGAGGMMPANAATGRAYSGINVLLLWDAAGEHGFSCNQWATYKQAAEMGGNVRRGEHGTRIVYADKFIPRAERERAAEQDRDAQAVYFLKSFIVFNREQIEGLPDLESSESLPEREMVAAGELLIQRSGADFRIGGNEAFYSPGQDFVQVPDQRQFPAQIDYYRTAAHELAHWTGHASRLNRNILNPFGSKDYAREELVAEMGAAFLCASLGIQPTVRHADYIGNWLTVLREDNRAIFKAASMASRATDLLLAKL